MSHDNEASRYALVKPTASDQYFEYAWNWSTEIGLLFGTVDFLLS